MNLQPSRPHALQQAVAAEALPAMPAPAGPATPLGGPEQPIFRLDIRRALELHRKLALSFAITGLVLALGYAVKSWPTYTAQSEIYVQPTSDKVMDQGNNAQRWPYDTNSYDSFIQQQVQLASNPDVLMSAMQKLPPGSWQRPEESEQAAAERLGGILKVERMGSSYLVAIAAKAKSAEMAADIANAVANSIVEKAAHEENDGDTQRLTILKAERERVENQLNADLAEQDALNKQLGMAAVGTEAPDLIDNAIGETRQELIKARTDHDVAEAQFASLNAGQGTSSAALDAQADELIASDPGLTSMKTSLNQRRATLITQMANLTQNNPEYKLDAEELSKINASLDSMMQELRAKAAARIQEKLRTDLERTAGVEAQLNGQLRQLAATAASATPKLQRANDLVTDIVRLRNRYAAVDEELHDIMIQDSVPGAVHISVLAVPPLHPSLVGILKKSLPLALGGILLGLLAALLAHNLDPRIYIGSDVEQLLGFAPMVALPDFGEVSDAVFEEHILRLATAIEHARKQGGLRNCIFTGTGLGVGVTTVVTRARNMLDSMGRPTVLVDATRTAHPASPASDQGARFQEVAETALAVPSGHERGNRPLSLLQRVTEESGAQDESLVLTDTAPLLISAETEYLARFVDCAIVVAESGVTTRAELRATADALQRLNVSAVGLVLNRVGLAKADAAFRNSVHGVETHLRASQRPVARSRHFAEEASAQEQEIRPPVARPRAPESNVRPSSEPSHEPAAPLHRAQPAAPQYPPQYAPQFASPAEWQATAPPAPPQPVQPPVWTAPVAAQPVVAAPEANLPWWLSETPLTTAAADAPAAANAYPGSAIEPGRQAAPASRLSGLRNVLFGAGAHGQEQQVAEKHEEPALPEMALPRFEPVPPAPVYDPVYAEPVYAEPAYAQPVYAPVPEPHALPLVPAEAQQRHETLRVVAPPEFLPPQPRLRPDSWESEGEPTPDRLDRRDTLDDIQVLPSRRGQYRRRS